MKDLFHLTSSEKMQLEIKLKEILQKRGEIIFTYIHGSFILDLPFHDVDLAVFINESRVNPQESLYYEIKLSIQLELELMLPFDIKIINFAPLPFQYEITKGKLLICQDKEIYYQFIEKTWMKYLDFKPYYYQSFRYLYNLE